MTEWGFWVVAGGITLAVFALLVQALRRSAPVQDDGVSLKVYRDQLTEVERDLARGLISAPEVERLRTEVSRRLLDADRARQTGLASPKAGSYGPAVVLIGVRLLAARGGYQWLGAPG